MSTALVAAPAGRSRWGEPRSPRAADFLTPVLFKLIAVVRRKAVRVIRGEGAAIHDFRVALRRLRSVLRPARCLYGKRRLRALGAELRRFAQATSALRDGEVLLETLAALDLPERAGLDAWLTRQVAQERELRRRVGALIDGGDPARGCPSLGVVLARLERRLGRPGIADRAARPFAEAALTEAVAGVAARRGAPSSDPTAMHALRIRYKRLRYVAELFEPVLGERVSAVAKEAERMQKRLGELHDLDEASVRVACAGDLDEATRTVLSRALAEARAQLCDRLRHDLVEA